MKRLLLVSRIIGCLLLGSGARAFAQNPVEDPGGSVVLEEIPSALLRAGEPVLKKMSGLLGLVESELSANRVPEKFAQDLRSAIANIPPRLDTEFPAALSSQLNTTDQAIAKAAAELETAWKLCADRRAALLRQADSEIRERVSKMARTAKSASDVEPLLQTLLRIEAAPPKRFGPDLQTVVTAISFLRALEPTFEPALMDDPGTESAVLNLLRRAGADDAKTRVDECQREAVRQEESLNAALDALLLGGGTFEKTWATLLEYLTAVSRHQMLEPSPDHYREPYVSLCECIELIEKRQWSDAQHFIQSTRSTLHYLGRDRELRFGKLLDEKEAEIATEIASGKLPPKPKPDLWAEINGAKSPGQLDAIAARLRSLPSDSPGEASGGFAEGLSNTLVQLSAAWKGSDPHFFVQMPGPARGNKAGRFPPELADLRLRVERDVWSRFLNAPELNQPPLVDQPLETAVGNLCKKLSTNGEWHRLIAILGTREFAVPIPRSEPQGQSALQSIRAFLAGRNLELAEEWSDAASAYKTVIQANLEGTPTKEAAERLAVLNREHPGL